MPSKELAHSFFRIKDVTAHDRLNSLYENDTRIMDCEKLDHSLSKKRFSMREATNRFNAQKKKDIAEVLQKVQKNEQLIDNKSMLAFRAKYGKTTHGKFLKPEDIDKIIENKIVKSIVDKSEKLKLTHKNYMLPSYHQKTHFKAAQSMNLAGESSLSPNDEMLKAELRLKNKMGVQKIIRGESPMSKKNLLYDEKTDKYADV